MDLETNLMKPSFWNRKFRIFSICEIQGAKCNKRTRIQKVRSISRDVTDAARFKPKASRFGDSLECEKNALKRLVFYGLKFNLKVFIWFTLAAKGRGGTPKTSNKLDIFWICEFLLIHRIGMRIHQKGLPMVGENHESQSLALSRLWKPQNQLILAEYVSVFYVETVNMPVFYT